MNPELRRNLWLEATRRKLAFSGALVAGVFAAVWLVDRGRHASAVTAAGALVYAAAALAWGPRAARSAVTAEAAAGSWDFQRLTAMTPWAMTWGKLAGATVRPWAVAAGGLLIAGLQLASTTSFVHALFWLMVAVALAVTLQASGMATGLIDVRRARASGRALSARAPGLLLLILALLTLAGLVWARARLGHVLDRSGLANLAGGPLPPVQWLGRPWPPLGFATLTLLALAGWALVWAWRLMRLELQHVNTPWAWAAFLACTGVYVAGFDPPAVATSPLAARLAAAAGAWAVLAYIAAFAGPADRVRARQFTAAVAERRVGRMLSRLPLTVAPSTAAFAAGVLVALIRAGQDDRAGALAMLAALAFFARDLGVIAWRRFAGRGRRSDAGVLLFLLSLYVLAAPVAWLFLRGRGLALFWPSSAHPRLNLIAATAEAALAWILAGAAVSRPTPPPRSLREPPPTTAVPPTGEPSDPGPPPSPDRAP